MSMCGSLRGGKGSLWQGGVRGVSWCSGGWLPAAVRGTVHRGLVGVWDWYGTLSQLCVTATSCSLPLLPAG